MQVKRKEDSFILLDTLQQALCPHTQIGRISEFSLHGYEPELNRYGASSMELVEAFFAHDSQYALKLARSIIPERSLHWIALDNMARWCRLTLTNPADQQAFAKTMFTNFPQEFQLKPVGFKQLNMELKKVITQNEDIDNPVSTALRQKWTKAFQQVIASYQTQHLAEKMLADLIHMHVNRLFVNRQRWHELILYHCLQHILRVGEPEQIDSD